MSLIDSAVSLWTDWRLYALLGILGVGLLTVDIAATVLPAHQLLVGLIGGYLISELTTGFADVYGRPSHGEDRDE